MAEDTIFEKIIRKEIPAKIRFENEHVLVIDDIHPQEKTHMLVLPKRKIAGVQSITSAEDYTSWTELLKAVQEIVKKYKLEDGYYLRVNVGNYQDVLYLHLHLLSNISTTE